MPSLTYALVSGLLASTAMGGLIKRNPLLAKRSCETGNVINDGQNNLYCEGYCETSSNQVTGAPIKVSDDLTCDTPTCSEIHSDTITITQTYTINLGIDIGSAEGDLKAGASAGGSWSWSEATATANSYSFTLNDGDSGHIVFRPYFQESCGELSYQAYDCTDDGFSCWCDYDTVVADDPNACGYTPILKSDGSADGDVTFCHTDAARNGEGC